MQSAVRRMIGLERAGPSLHNRGRSLSHGSTSRGPDHQGLGAGAGRRDSSGSWVRMGGGGGWGGAPDATVQVIKAPDRHQGRSVVDADLDRPAACSSSAGQDDQQSALSQERFRLRTEAGREFSWARRAWPAAVQGGADRRGPRRGGAPATRRRRAAGLICATNAAEGRADAEARRRPSPYLRKRPWVPRVSGGGAAFKSPPGTLRTMNLKPGPEARGGRDPGERSGPKQTIRIIDLRRMRMQFRRTVDEVRTAEYNPGPPGKARVGQVLPALRRGERPIFDPVLDRPREIDKGAPQK